MSGERRHDIVRLPTGALWSEQTYRAYLGAIERRAGRERRTVERLSRLPIRLAPAAAVSTTREEVDVARRQPEGPVSVTVGISVLGAEAPDLAAGPSPDRRSLRAGRPATSTPVTFAQPPQQGGSQEDGAPFTVPTLRPAEGAGQRPDAAGGGS